MEKSRQEISPTSHFPGATSPLPEPLHRQRAGRRCCRSGGSRSVLSGGGGGGGGRGGGGDGAGRCAVCTAEARRHAIYDREFLYRTVKLGQVVLSYSVRREYG
jgi:hypothetical protein